LEIHRSPEGFFDINHYLQHPVDGILKDAIALHIKGHPPYLGSEGQRVDPLDMQNQNKQIYWRKKNIKLSRAK